MPRASTSSPAASTRTRTSTCRSAGPTRSTTSSRARSPPRTAARRRSSTSRSRRRAAFCARALDTWHAKAEGRALVDYAFHMIATDLPPPVLDEMGAIVKEGVTSFKLFMAYPGVLLLDDQSIFRAMLRAGELGALICMHAETGLPIDVLVERAIAAGHTAPILSRADAARGRPRRPGPPAPSRSPRWPRCRCTSCTCRRSARSSALMEARDRGLPAYAETCPQYLFLSEDDLARQAWRRVRRRQVRLHARRCARSITTIICARACATTISRLSRPTTGPFCMKGQKEARPRRLLEDSRTACRASRPACTSCTKACATAASRSTASSRSPRRRRPRSSASIRRRAP